MAANIAANKLKTAENNLFDLLDDPEEVDPTTWIDMPAMNNPENESEFRVVVRFRTMEDAIKFGDLIGDDQVKTKGKSGVKSIWWPKAKSGERGSNQLLVWMDSDDEELKGLV